jgi:hypothetical protein
MAGWIARAEQLRSHQRPSNIRLCHTIELILKAYIASRRGITSGELKELSETDLTKILDQAMRLGLTVSPSIERDIEKLIEARAEYLAHPSEAANRVLVSEYFVERDIDELFKAVRQKLAG